MHGYMVIAKPLECAAAIWAPARRRGSRGHGGRGGGGPAEIDRQFGKGFSQCISAGGRDFRLPEYSSFRFFNLPSWAMPASVTSSP